MFHVYVLIIQYLRYTVWSFEHVLAYPSHGSCSGSIPIRYLNRTKWNILIHFSGSFRYLPKLCPPVQLFHHHKDLIQRCHSYLAWKPHLQTRHQDALTPSLGAVTRSHAIGSDPTSQTTQEHMDSFSFTVYALIRFKMSPKCWTFLETSPTILPHCIPVHIPHQPFGLFNNFLVFQTCLKRVLLQLDGRSCEFLTFWAQ